MTNWSPEPGLAAARSDPLAVALANATLFGAGYALLRRWRLLLGTGLVTAALVTLLATAPPSGWYVAALALWWVAVVGHGWYLAAGGPRPLRRRRARQQRLVALGVTVPVLLAVGLLRFDAGRIDRDATGARLDGDCPRALAALDRFSAGHRVAAHLTDRGEDTRRACGVSRRAAGYLATGLTGDLAALDTGFVALATVLADLPGHERVVGRTLDRFLAGLPTDDPCRTRAVTDWLREQRQLTGAVVAPAAETVDRVAPAAIVGCADTLRARALARPEQQVQVEEWEQARAGYRHLLAQYPDHELADAATENVRRATLAIELATVRDLLKDSYRGSLPSYCAKPAPYSRAAPYRRGAVNRALLFGPELDPEHNSYSYRGKLPGAWLTGDVTRATLVVCAGKTTFGSRVESCPYENRYRAGGTSWVTFRTVVVPVRVHEVRTGRLVRSATVRVRGASCPRVLRYETLAGLTPLGPPSEVYVKPSTSDVRAAFGPLFR